MVHRSQRDELGSAFSRHPDTVQAGPAGPLTYPRWGSEVKRRDPARVGPKRGLSVRCNTYLVPQFGRGCVSRAFDDALEPPTAACWREREKSLVRCWSLHDSPCPLGTQRQREPLLVEIFYYFFFKPNILRPALLRGRERCIHHLPKQSSFPLGHPS